MVQNNSQNLFSSEYCILPYFANRKQKWSHVEATEKMIWRRVSQIIIFPFLNRKEVTLRCREQRTFSFLHL
ncbi:ORF207 [White spot syndrome virus]|uniref:ORF207 n=1 Tax=White spot syndrome virus TaxID=342409 RepID=A0A2D3I6K7_9VIRU|nr:ORF207 [White spot syndrome virus]